MTEPQQTYLLNPAVQFFPAAKEGRILCQLLQDDGSVIASYLLKSELQDWLLQFDGKQELAQLVAQQAPSTDKLTRLVQEFLLPQRILLDPQQPVVTLNAQKPEYMLFQLPLLTAKQTQICSQWLQHLFTPIFAWPLAILTTLSFCLVWLTLLFNPTMLSTEPASSEAAIHTVLLITAALLLHELGHTAAAIRYGCHQVHIGIGGYLCFLIFYADLSQSWRLPAKKRLVVDLAGSYLQGLVALLYLWIYAIWDYPPYLAAFVLLNVYTLYNLNPFFRMDGYWVASDLLQIPNLRARSGALLQQFFTQPLSHIYRCWKQRALSVLAWYTITSSIVFILFSYIMLVSIAPTTISRLQDLLTTTPTAKATHADVLVYYTQLGWNSMIAIFLLLFCNSLGQMLWRFLTEVKKGTKQISSNGY